MNINRFTEKAQEAVFAAQREAEARSHTTLEPEHLLSALLDQANSVPVQVLSALGVDLPALRDGTKQRLGALPRADGVTQLYLLPRTKRLIDGAAKSLILEEGYDPLYGARPLKRALQRRVLDPLAIKLLERSVRPSEIVRADAQEGSIVFSHIARGEVVEEEPEPAAARSA